MSKDESIETLRGLAIILMVMGHVIGDTSNRGLRVADDSVFRYIYCSLEFMRMPLFAAISGFVYAMRPASRGASLHFIKGKFRRIGLPLLSISTIHFMAIKLVPGTNTSVELSEMWRIYFFGFEHLWFLQAILLIFLVVVLLEHINLILNFQTWAGCLLASYLCSYFLPKINFFSLHGFLYLLPYFLFGIGLNIHKEFLYKKLILWILLLVFTGGVVVQQLNWFGMTNIYLDRFSPIAFCIGIGGIYFLFKLRFPISWLAALGTYSYGIYLFHVFPAAGSRIVLKNIGLHNTTALLAICLTTGLLVPVVLEKLIEKNVYLRKILLGMK